MSRAIDEFLLTSVLLFTVVTAVRWEFDPSSPLHVNDTHGALAIVGSISAVVLVALILSPPGGRSGGHMNPSITIALWLMNVFPGATVLPYVTAQLAGSVAGVAAGRLVWGPIVSGGSVGYAEMHPGGWGAAAVFLAESGCLIGLTLLVGFFLAHPSYSRWLPGAVGAVVVFIIVFFGPLSGGSANPARALGPAVLSGKAVDLWIYCIAPVVGAVLGAGLHHLLFQRFDIRQPLTYKLCGYKK